jgi:hypothetical protein
MIEDLEPQSDTLLSPLREENISRRILTVRGHSVILDSDLAALYLVSTSALNQAVKRNAGRFPEDFAFRIATKEKEEVVTKCDHLSLLKFSPALPFAYTEASHRELAQRLDALEKTYDASRRGEIDEPPSENILRLKERKPFIDPFSFREMKLLLEHVDPHYGKFIRNRSRKDGGRFLEGLKEAEASANGKA